ncbi:MAG: glycosyltransferase family 2 protein [Candidatus Woesebacteria bacterium]|nr:MAG: glycosyltransferase family 2 protein [Candidatus Woesebacteria bacterium]
MRNFIIRHEKRILRLLEILPGMVSWNLILFPYWGILVIPVVVAYFILFFNIYWFYQSLQIAISSIVSHLKIQSAKIYDWMGDVRGFPDWERVRHIVIIPTYNEPVHILERTLKSLADQEFPTKHIIPVFAMEGKETRESRNAKSKELKAKFGKYFDHIFVTTHELEMGEVAGKASNERFAAIWIKKNYIDRNKIDLNYVTVTSCDADHKFHPKHFANLTYKFLDNPKRYKTFWQPAVMFYNNIWEIPAITRVPNTLMTIWNLSLLPRHDRLINAQNYSLSFKLLDSVGYWDPDKIPEDWGIFFKAFYKSGGGIEVEPIYLPLMADAAQSSSFWKTLQNQYQQIQRWAWGVSDDPWIIKSYLLARDVPFWDKTTRLFQVIWAHFLWPVNWFIITIGLTLPTLLNPAFGRTALGYTVPKLSSFILTISLVFLVIMLVIDNIQKPARPKEVSVWRQIFTPFEFILMPIAGFFFSALPGIDAHTRLMLGKYIEYRVTEKV